MGTLALILAPAALFVGGVWLVLELRRRRAADPDRPWWGEPLVWVGVCATWVVLGLFVAPRLLGFTFLFLPFLLSRRSRGRRGGRSREA
jgi:hypothetical protein